MEPSSYLRPGLVGSHPALDLTLFRRMADMSNDAFYLVDEDGRILYLNHQARALNGYTEAELESITVPVMMPEFPPDRFRELLDAIATNGVPLLETIARHKDGHVTPIETSVACFTVEGARYFFGVARDITERKELETTRKGFAQRMLQNLEAERHRVARELHDDVGQAVATVGVLLHALARTSGPGGRDWRAELDAINGQIRQITESVARIVRDHHPAELVGLGLEDALRSHVLHFTQRHTLTLQLTTVSVAGLLPHDQELHVYRIVQEALTNVARHARANRVSVRLTRKGARLMAVVRDNGVGFTVGPRPRGFGLATMRERAELIGATLTVRATPGQGTEIRVDVPLAVPGRKPARPARVAPAPRVAPPRRQPPATGRKRPSPLKAV